MKKAAIFSCLILGGCLSVDLTSNPAFEDVVGKALSIKRPALISKGSVMKSVAFGGSLDVLILRETPPDFKERVGKGWETDSIHVPVGTELRVDRIERRNLIDAGVEIMVFGMIRNPRSGMLEPFAYELTRGLGDTIGRAPWEDSSIPEVRQWESTGPRGTRLPPINDGKKG